MSGGRFNLMITCWTDYLTNINVICLVTVDSSIKWFLRPASIVELPGSNRHSNVGGSVYKTLKECNRSQLSRITLWKFPSDDNGLLSYKLTASVALAV